MNCQVTSPHIHDSSAWVSISFEFYSIKEGNPTAGADIWVEIALSVTDFFWLPFNKKKEVAGPWLLRVVWRCFEGS